MNNLEFEQFVSVQGKEILRFCRMTAGNSEDGDELYQDTMLKLMEKIEQLDPEQNLKSYCLSISILLWKNKKRKYARHFRMVPTESMEELEEQGGGRSTLAETETEQIILKKEAIKTVQKVVAALPQKLRLPIYLYYSAEMPIKEIAECLCIPESTVKSRMRKAKAVLKKDLEALNYD